MYRRCCTGLDIGLDILSIEPNEYEQYYNRCLPRLENILTHHALYPISDVAYKLESKEMRSATRPGTWGWYEFTAGPGREVETSIVASIS